MHSFRNKLSDFISGTIDYVGRLVCHPHCICCDIAFDIDDDGVFCSACYEEIMSRKLDVSAGINNKYVDKL